MSVSSTVSSTWLSSIVSFLDLSVENMNIEKKIPNITYKLIKIFENNLNYTGLNQFEFRLFTQKLWFNVRTLEIQFIVD